VSKRKTKGERVNFKTKIAGFASKWSSGWVGEEGFIDFVWVPLLPRLAHSLTQIRNGARRLLAANDFQAFARSGRGSHSFPVLGRRDSIAVLVVPGFFEMLYRLDNMMLRLWRGCRRDVRLFEEV
jgi:hypothetical protein